MKKLFSILFLAYSLFAMAEAPRHTFSGTVTDATNGESLIGASVTVKELRGTGITTNGYGYFSLTLPDGQYTFVVSYLGYSTQSISIKLDNNRQLNIKLEPNSTELDDVIITAQARNNNITSTEIGMEKLEVKEISKIPVIFGEADIMKTLKLTP